LAALWPLDKSGPASKSHDEDANNALEARCGSSARSRFMEGVRAERAAAPRLRRRDPYPAV
jgi:hypothetical protein